jgi:hypothetical protein
VGVGCGCGEVMAACMAPQPLILMLNRRARHPTSLRHRGRSLAHALSILVVLTTVRTILRMCLISCTSAGSHLRRSPDHTIPHSPGCGSAAPAPGESAEPRTLSEDFHEIWSQKSPR